MRKRILSILVSISMALLLVPTVPFAMASDDAAGGAPSISAFATKDQLMTEFSSKDPTNIGKLVFGKNDQGKPQEWYVLGKDTAVSGDNTMIFATSALAQKQVFRANPVNAIPYDPSWGCDYHGNTVTEVAANHYGSSDLRSALQAMASSTSYFTTAEQGMMNATTIDTNDFYYTRNLIYSTTDLLYPLQHNPMWAWGDVLYIGSADTIRSVEWDYVWNYSGLFWTRQAAASDDGAAKVAWCSMKQFYEYPVNLFYDARPAGNLNLGNVLFASAAEASADGVKAGTIAPGKAMTLRMDGRGKSIGTVSYHSGDGLVYAKRDSAATLPVSLVIQGNDGTKDWYYSINLKDSEETYVTAGMLKVACGLESVSLADCKIWLEATDSSARMSYAKMATQDSNIKGYSMTQLALKGVAPVAGQELPSTCQMTPATISCSVAYSKTVDGKKVAATGVAEWDTTYTATISIGSFVIDATHYYFDSSVYVKVDEKPLPFNLSPSADGTLTVTCEFTTPKRCAITGIAVAPSAPDNNTFSTYYGFDGYKALPTDGDELGSTVSVAVLDRQDNSTQNVNMPVTWSFVGGYERSPGASNKLAWTIPASALADYDATSCPGYDAATGGISGTVELRNKEATPVSITDSGASRYFAFKSPSTAVDVSALFDIDANAGPASYELSEGTTEGASLTGTTLTVTQPGAYAVRLETAENGIYAAGYDSTLVWVVEPFRDLVFGTATYGYSPISAQPVTFTNTSDSYAMTSIEATSSYFEVDGLPANSSIVSGGTATLNVKPKEELGAGTYSEVIVIHASSGHDFGYDSYITATFTVEKAGIAPAVELGDWTYGTGPAEPVIIGNAGGGSVSYFHKPQGTADSAYTAGLPVDAGSYTLKGVVAETANYLGGDATCNFEIAKADAAVSAAPSAKSGLAYTGVPQELVSAGTASGGTMEYSLDGVEWSSVVSTATKVGSYTVFYRVTGDANHYDAAGGTVSASIAVAKTAIGLSASASSLTGGGTVTLTVNTSWLPAGADYKLVCMDPEVAFSVTGQDAYSVTLPNKTQRYAFRAYCAGTDNYTGSQSDHVYVEVTRYDPPVPPTIDLPVTAGGSGGILAGGQLVGSKVVVSNIA